MKKTLTINLAGIVFHIDEDAYNLLDNYITNLHNYFRKENGADEIIHDMELRISELFTEKLAESGKEVITVEDVESIIAIMGKPEQMDSCEEKLEEPKKEYRSTGSKKLFRDTDNQVLGGVCSGIANYFGWDVTLVRIGMLFGAFFIHGLILAYIVLWIVVPPARTATEKLAMHGQKVNVENIGKTVTEGFEKVKNTVQSNDSRSTFRSIGEGLVSAAGFLIKCLLIILAVCCAPILLIMLIVFFALIFVSMGVVVATPSMMLGLSDFIPVVNWSTVGAFPVDTIGLSIAGIFIIGIPIIGIIHMIMRHFGGWQPMSTVTRIVFIVLWFIAVGLGVYFALHAPFLNSWMYMIH